MTTNIHAQPKQTTAFMIQSALSFGIALLALLVGVANLPVEPWTRGFLAIGLLYVVTSTFTLAKVVRDAHETHTVLSRVDEARLERLLQEHDPFKPAI
ncbi:MAG TPA: YiaA/YiaB family inner membrane protein [Acidimicrobiales bacterium]|nr:YiaA/YiaB family inner membrane protein [Acidimicrobiales bacterium]